MQIIIMVIHFALAPYTRTHSSIMYYEVQWTFHLSIVCMNHKSLCPSANSLFFAFADFSIYFHRISHCFLMHGVFAFMMFVQTKQKKIELVQCAIHSHGCRKERKKNYEQILPIVCVVNVIIILHI